ncbi:MAG: hypothetical protein Q9224_006810, partial [Gallowayella concinna]
FGVTTEAAPDAQQFTFRQPIITGKRAAIARAAYDAGFDCSDPNKLLHLLDAVVLAKNKFGYPDKWDGPAAFQSTLYPDTWTSAHASRKEHVSKTNTYEDFERHPAVPAFGASATDIIRNLGAQQKYTSGSKRQPLGELRESWSNKRPAAAPLPGKPAKRFRTEVSSSLHSATTSHTLTIHQDEPEHRLPARPRTAAKVSRLATDRVSGGNQRHGQRAARTHQAETVAAGTHTLLAKVASKLRAKVQSLNWDRESLRARWEVDQRLQLISITDYLKGVNEHFNRAEEALEAASTLIEHYIM